MNLRSVGVVLLRSLTPTTGALVAGVGTAAPILAETLAESAFGRPSSTALIGLPIAVIVGLVASIPGAAIGGGVWLFVRRTRWAGPVGWGLITILLAALVIISTAWSVASVFKTEAFNKPRVITTTGQVVRNGTPAVLKPRTDATLMWASLPEIAQQAKSLPWNGHVTRLSLDGARLMVTATDSSSASIDISRFDYVREIYGVTTKTGGAQAEWLALLVRLRATGDRELLLVFGPSGALAYEELIERRTALSDKSVLWRVGSSVEELVVDLDSPIAYIVIP